MTKWDHEDDSGLCAFCPQPWPCDAETERNARLAAEAALGSAARIANESMAEARAAEGERDRLREALQGLIDAASAYNPADRARAIDAARAALTGAKE